MQSIPRPSRMPRMTAVFGGALVSLTLMSCLGEEPGPQACPALAAVGLHVTVRAAHDQGAICDAHVQAIDGDYSETLEPWEASDSCSYAGAFNRPGTYQVDVVHPDFEVKTTTATVTATGPCPADIEAAEIVTELEPLESARHGDLRAIFAIAGRR